MNVSVRKHPALNNYFFYVANFTLLTSLLLLSLCRLSFPLVGLKIFSLPIFVLKSPNRIFVLKMKKNLFYFIIKMSFESSLFSSLCALAFRTMIWHQLPLFSSLCALAFRTMIWHQLPLRTVYNTLSLTKTTLLTADELAHKDDNAYLPSESSRCRTGFLLVKELCLQIIFSCHTWPSFHQSVTWGLR
jgi:uncharacterized membrane protein